MADGLWVAFAKAEVLAVRRRVSEIFRVDDPPSDVADVALLVLDAAAPQGVRPAPLRAPVGADLVDRTWWAFGFPDGKPFGSAADGHVGAALAYGWMRLDTGSSYKVKQGFSGGGLWSPEYQAVVGLVGQVRVADEHAGDGLALTLRQIAAWLPEHGLGKLARWSVQASGEAALAAWGWTLRDDPEAGRHWRPRARGVAIDSEHGFRFRGRTAALTEITAWLGRPAPDRRVLVVTGSPGVGKSAVLGRVVTTADAGIRAVLPVDDEGVKAEVGSVSCAVHAKGKTAHEVAAEIARAASVGIPERVEDLSPALRAGLSDTPTARGRFNVVVDALDEASTPEQARLVVTGIVLPMVQTCADLNVQVVVGSRRRDEGGDLLGTFAGAATVLDLDTPEYFAEADLEAYVLATLQLSGDERPDSPYADLRVAEPLAARIAAEACGNFLVGGLVARAYGLHDLVATPPERVQFTPTVNDALSRYLQRVPPVGGVPAATVLTVLGFAEAPGLPVELWSKALDAWGASVGAEHLLRFARSAVANFLVESSEAVSGRCYRLFHQALNDVLVAARADVYDAGVDERALTDAWLTFGRGVGWDRAPRYLLRSLPAHAAVANRIDDLLLDDAYLRHVDLRRLTPLADHAVAPAALDRARMLRLTPHAIPAEPRIRAAMFNLTTTLEHLEHAYPTTADAPYTTVWAATTPRRERLTLTGHTGWVNGVCPIQVGDRQLLASASSDTTVRVWDPATGQHLHTLTGHTGGVSGVCPIQVGDRQLLASASYDQTVRVWDPATGQHLHTLTGHTGMVNGVCPIQAGDRQLLASASNDHTVRVWDPATGQHLHTLTGHTDWVNGVCPIQVGDRQLLASASGDRTVRVWDPATGQHLHTLTGHTDWVRGVCPIRVGDHQLLASASDDTTVRIWDPTTGSAWLTINIHHRVWGGSQIAGLLVVATDPGLVAIRLNDYP